MPIARPTTAKQSGEQARRVLNVAVALLLLVVTLPVWIVIALAIKLTSRGPVFYTQVRVGLDRRSRETGIPERHRRQNIGGRPFRIYKFRTMRDGAEHATGAVWATPNDPRVTAVGRILRDYRLDELPQLLNVLRGDMNLVGPRPERPAIIESLRNDISRYATRQKVLPGITGHAQVNLAYDSNVDDVRRKVDLDVEYVRKASVWEDLKILLQTVPVVLFRRGSR